MALNSVKETGLTSVAWHSYIRIFASSHLRTFACDGNEKRREMGWQLSLLVRAKGAEFQASQGSLRFELGGDGAASSASAARDTPAQCHPFRTQSKVSYPIYLRLIALVTMYLFIWWQYSVIIID